MAYALLLFCALIGWSRAFLPSPSLDLQGLTHADITEEALLEVATVACREEAQNEGRVFNPPPLLTPESLLHACLGVSEDADLSGSKFRELLDEIISENIVIDRDHGFSSAHHFNDEVFERGKAIITQGVFIIRANIQQNNLEAARRALGAVTHTLQDFYSHSNWFELGHLQPNANLLRPDLPLQNIADASTPTCKDCEEKVCPNVILPEIFKSKTLTSGYLTFTPQGKCNHGDSTIGGINKDFGGGDLTPDGTDPHLAAYSAATQATKDLLQNIRIAFGNTVFLSLLGITRSSVICFVVDTTGSMTDDIAEVRRLINRIIDSSTGTPDEPSLYILVEFNDPEVGPVTSTTDPEEMKQLINNIRVAGGGDIPELSLSGLQLALTTAPPSSDIFMFTDAPPKDEELLSTVTSLIESTRSRVSFMLTNALFRRRRRSAVTNPGNSLYEQLAQVSGGQAIEVTKATLPLVTVVIQDSITSTLVTLLQVDSTKPDTFYFLVDTGVQNVTLYITGLSVSFTLENPSGISQDNTAGTGLLASVSLVGNLYRVSLNEGNQTGKWFITIRSPQAYSLRVRGRSTMNFMMQFVEMFGGPHPGFAPIPARPPAGQNATLLITVTGGGMLFQVNLRLLSASGEVLRNTSIMRLREGTYLASVPHLPDVPFTVQLMGARDGRPFQRQSTTQIQASQITVQVQRIVTMEPSMSASIPFTVEARGIEGTISIHVRDDQNFVTHSTSSVNIGATGNVTGVVNLKVPTSTQSGTTSVVTIEAASAATGQSNFALLRVSVIEKITDLTPPVCRVVNESLDCPLLCGDAMFEVTLLMTDGNGTGLQSPHVSATIPDMPINDTVMVVINVIEDENGYNATLLKYRASCCLTDVEISAVDKVGNVGRCDFSIRHPSTVEPPQTTNTKTNISTNTSTTTNATTTTTSNNTHTTPSNSLKISMSLCTMLLLTAFTYLFF